MPKITVKRHENKHLRDLFAIIAFANVRNLKIRGKNPRDFQFEKSAKSAKFSQLRHRRREEMNKSTGALFYNKDKI
jgi:hypothetical protein